MKAANVPEVDRLQGDLESIKRLLVLLLLKAGATQTEVASALGVRQGTVSRMFPGERIRKFPGRE